MTIKTRLLFSDQLNSVVTETSQQLHIQQNSTSTI